jgi:hypothetical protein
MNYLTKIILLIILISSISTSNAQKKTNKKLEKIIKKIEKQEYLFKNYELKPKVLRTASKLNEIASEEELIILSEKKCKLCFSYAFWVLSKRKSKFTKSMYENYSKNLNTETLKTINEFKRNKSCIKVIMTENNMIEEIYMNEKYLNKLK